MKTLLFSGLVLAILSGGAMAQSATAPLQESVAQTSVKGGGTPSLPLGAPTGGHIRLEDGDAAVDVKCADNEPMKQCAEITLQILERLVSLPKPKS